VAGQTHYRTTLGQQVGREIGIDHSHPFAVAHGAEVHEQFRGEQGV
jgi:hypothetical protein